MSAINKEKIYEELRAYHQNVFPDKFPSAHLDKLREEFGLVEDEVVSMLLGLVNGKRIYAELSDLSQAFLGKLSEVDAAVFRPKYEQLIKLMATAKAYDFPLRKVRVKATKA